MATAETMHTPEIASQRDPLQVAVDTCRYLLAGAAGCYLVLYIALACIRLVYPYELEWMEGGCVDQVRWILAGKSLYVEPSVAFVPFCYTPLYFWVAAGLTKVMGVGFVPLRLVSLVASLGCFGVLFQFVRRETGSGLWGLVAAGLYAGTYRLSGAWFDLGREDSLFMMLLLAGIYFVRFGEGFWPLLLAGGLMGLAFLTKQTALLVAVPLIVYVFVGRRRWPAIAFGGSFVLILVGTTVAFDIATHGWYSYYVFRVPAGHDSLPAMVAGFWTVDLARPLAIAMALTVFAVVSRLASGVRGEFAFYVALAAGTIGAGWLGRLHGGGYDNVLQPAYAMLAIGLAAGASVLQAGWQGREGEQVAEVSGAARGGSAPGGRLARSLALGLQCVVLIQFALLAYSPGAQIPNQEDVLAGDGLVKRLQEIEGDVWIPYHGFLPAMAGHEGFGAHAMAINDVLRGPDGEGKQRLLGGIRQAIRDRRFRAIVLDDEWLFKKEIQQHYDAAGLVFQEKNVFWPVTGWRTRPMLMCLGKPTVPASQPVATRSGKG